MGQALENARALIREGIEEGRPREAVEAYTGDRYTQHSHPVPDGPDGFVAFFEDFQQRHPERRIEVVRAFQDGRYVVMHMVQWLGGEPTWVTMDILDSDEDDRMVEHWDVIAAWRGESASGRTMVDGPTEPADLDRTADNKAHVRRFVQEVLVAGDVDALAAYVADELREHDPDAADGLEALRATLAAGPDEGGPTAYHELHLLAGQGDLVMTLSHAAVRGTDSAVMDLFRVADGRIAEHWRVAEPMPPADELVNSGKF